MKNTSVALLISTYNWPEALDLVLLSVLRQTMMPDEILIADDGSGDVTKKVVDNFKIKTEAKVQHIWHKDKGFRKSIILNKAIAKTKAAYIIQVDGDCILHPSFVEDHIKNIEENMYLYGTRVRIKQKFVEQVFHNSKIDFNFFTRGLKKRPRSLRVPFLSKFFKKQLNISTKFRGCNTSYWRKDFIKVNGYNEDIMGWGREDSELMIRMHNADVLAKRLKFSGIVYHLDHNEESKEQFQNNDTIEKTTISEKRKFCKNGIDKYL